MYEKYIKRLIDILLSFFLLIVLSPILFVVAILVYCKLGSPIIFKQKRPGKNEIIFEIYKFRTMTDKKDENGNLLPDADRLTKFGKFLRSTSLDELPELINILKGDMSIIGPRALLVSYLNLYNKDQRRRHEVMPGLVGLAALNGRNDQSWEDKFKADIYYVDHISFKLDLLIFIKAIGVVLSRKGVSKSGEETTVAFTGKEENE